MSPDQHPSNPGHSQKHVKAATERAELLDHVQAVLEPAMIALGLVFLGLLLFDYASVGISALTPGRIDQALELIWIIFLLDFAVRFVIAPAKGAFLRQNWLGAVSLVLPFLRPLRALRAARAVRSLSLVRLLGGINRAMRVLRLVTRGRQAAYVAALTLFVVLVGAVGVLYFDRDVEAAPIKSFGDALWWSAAMVTTINNEQYVVSPEARVIGILQRVYAVSIFGYLTASIATYLIGSRSPARNVNGVEHEALAEIRTLRHEVEQLRISLEQAVPDLRHNDDPELRR